MLRARLLTLLGFAAGIALVFAGSLAAQSTTRASAQSNPYSIFLPLVYGPASCSVPPTLVGPANGTSLGTLVPLFQWTPVNDPAATFMTLQVASDTSFSDTSVVAQVSFDPSSTIWTTGDTRLPGNLDPSTVYYWRTYVACGSYQGPYSPSWSLKTADANSGQLLPAPQLVSPPFGTPSVSPNTLTLTWQPVSGAIDYLVVWYPAGAGSISFTYVAATNQNDTNQQVTIGPLFPNTQYEWYVQARNYYADGYGQGQPCSSGPCPIQPWQFSTAAAAPASTLAVRSASGARATGAIGVPLNRPGAR